MLVLVFTVSLSLTGNGQALLVENFDYTAGALLTASGWTNHSGTSEFIDVAVPGLTFTGYPLSNIGGMAQLDNNGEDVHRKFTVQSTGKVYAAFMVQINGSAEGYIIHFGGDPIALAFRPKLFLVGTASPFNFGLSVGSNTATPVAGGSYIYGKTYLLVLKYEIVEGEKNDVVSLYIMDAAVSATEPATPTIGPLTDNSQTDITPGPFALRQFSTSQKILVDGIRVATSWADAVTAPLGGDTFAPVFAAGFPKLSAVNAAGATLEVSMDEPGKAFYMVVPNDAAAPTTDQVIVGAAYGSVTPVAQGSIDIAAAGTVYTKVLTGLATKTDFDIYVVARDDEATPNKQAAPVKLELYTDKQPDILYSANFETSLLPFTQVNVTGDEQIWNKPSANAYALMNGFSGSAKENEDWLVSPALKLDTAETMKLSFKTAKSFIGPALKVMMSTNFTGTYTPAGISAATWTDITSSFEFSTGSWNWKPSGEYAFPVTSGKAYVAFVYTSTATTDGAAAWEVDDFLVTGYVKNTSVAQPAVSTIRIYPVPARNELVIDNAGNVKRAEIYDISGRLHLTRVNKGDTRIRMDVSHLNPGVFLVRFATSEGVKVEKFIKE